MRTHITHLRTSLLALAFVLVGAALGSAGAGDAEKEDAKQADTAARIRKIDRELEARARPYMPLVDAFYRYDVGLLGGVEASRVRSEWARLHDEAAIPAVVAGLRRALRSGASCPIFAFSAKLRELLARSTNPEMGAYVLRHLPRGSGIPYASTVRSVEQAALRQLMRTRTRQYGRQSLLNRMRRGSSERTVVGVAGPLIDLTNSARTRPPDVRTQTKSAPDPAQEQTSVLITHLAKGRCTVEELEELEERARGPRAAELLEHVGVLLRVVETPTFPPSHRITAIRILGRLRTRSAVPALIEALNTDNDRLRSEVAMALARITKRLFGPAPGASREEVQQAIERWRQWWQEEGSAKTDGDR